MTENKLRPLRGRKCDNRSCSNETEFDDDDLCPWCRERLQSSSSKE